MADYDTEIEQLEVQLEGLETNLAGASAMSAAFQNELGAMQVSMSTAGREARGLSGTLSSGLRSAFGDLVFEGAKLSDVLRDVARSMIETTFNQAISPVTDAISGALTGGLSNILGGMLSFEKGGAFASGNVTAFAKGGLVDSPTFFPMRGGMGLMGEAGAEAIMPLSRGADGSLGVRAQGGQSVTVNMNIQTPDAAGFKRSSTQIAASVQRAMQRGQRNQ